MQGLMVVGFIVDEILRVGLKNGPLTLKGPGEFISKV